MFWSHWRWGYCRWEWYRNLREAALPGSSMSALNHRTCLNYLSWRPAAEANRSLSRTGLLGLALDLCPSGLFAGFYLCSNLCLFIAGMLTLPIDRIYRPPYFLALLFSLFKALNPYPGNFAIVWRILSIFFWLAHQSLGYLLICSLFVRFLPVQALA